MHLAVTLAAWPLALVTGRSPAVSLTVVLLGAAVLVTVVSVSVLRARQVRRACYRLARRVELEHAERALALVYRDWLDLETRRGLAELERWRRDLSP